MKYQLSTLCLSCAIIALGLGWYLDHPTNLQSRLVGRWRHPFLGVGYWENIYFEPDGRFRRVVHYRVGKDIFVGEYEILAENKISISFTERWDSGSQAMRQLRVDEKENADCWVACAFDSDENLLLVNLNTLASGGNSFECGIPSRNYERGEFTFQRAVSSKTNDSEQHSEKSTDEPGPFDFDPDDPFDYDPNDPFQN